MGGSYSPANSIQKRKNMKSKSFTHRSFAVLLITMLLLVAIPAPQHLQSLRVQTILEPLSLAEALVRLGRLPVEH